MKWCRRFSRRSAASVMIGAAAADGAVLRVCADPNNLPFSDQAGQGFENKIVGLIARISARPSTIRGGPNGAAM